MPPDEDARSHEILGFCPSGPGLFTLSSAQLARYDYLFVSYRGIAKRSTLAHELGHYFGLQHPDRLMPVAEVERLGLTSPDVRARNLMSYVALPTDLTPAQLQDVSRIATTVRAYLAR